MLPKLPDFGKEWPLPLLRSSQSCPWMKIDAKERARGLCWQPQCSSSTSQKCPVTCIFAKKKVQKGLHQVSQQWLSFSILEVFPFLLFFSVIFIIFFNKQGTFLRQGGTTFFQRKIKYLSRKYITKDHFLKEQTVKIISDKLCTVIWPLILPSMPSFLLSHHYLHS